MRFHFHLGRGRAVRGRLVRNLSISAWLYVVSLLLAAGGAAQAAWSPRGMVAADHRLASAAGVEILKAGGNAVDAAVATALAVCVANPSSCGLGGGGFMLIYNARAHRAVALDYRETAPAAASRDMFVRDGKAIPELSLRGGLAVAVPGEIAGLAAALRRYGKLSWRQVMQPAIRLAREGFPIEPHLADQIEHETDALRGEPELARTFLHKDGSPLRAGETLRRPQLASTLEKIARRGPAVFYHGEIAEKIVAAVRSRGGVMSGADLAGYRPTWRQPLRGSYKGHEIITMPPPSSGGGVLLEVLGILRDDVLPGLGHNSAAYAHLVAEAMTHAFADRAQFYGDPDFASVPLDVLLSPANVRGLRARIATEATLDRRAYGSAAPARQAAASDHGTSHLSVVDAEGNAVACTRTINTGFGAMVMAGDTGILLNNEMDDFSAQPGASNAYGLIGAEANAVASRKRPLSSMTPTIVTKDNKVVLSLGGSGGPFIISGTLQVLLDVVDFDFPATEAVAAPRVHDQWMPPFLGVEPGIAADVREALAAYGHPVKEVAAMAAIQAIRVYPNTLEGASDSRKGGEAVGW